MSWISQLGQAVWNALWGALAGPFAALVNELLGWDVSAVGSTPNLSNAAVQTVWTITYGVFLGALGIAIAGIGLMYILSPVAERKFQLKQLWTKLGFALVLGSCTIVIGNFCIAVSSQLATAILAQGDFDILSSNYWSGGFGSSAGPLAVALYLMAIILLVTLLVEQGVRILMVFFTGAILPWAFLLWSFPVTNAYGTKVLKMFFEWTFVNIFIAIVLVLTSLILNAGQGTSNTALNVALVLGGFALAAAMPKVMTETGGAVSNVGQAVMGGVLGAGTMGGGSSGFGGEAALAGGGSGGLGGGASGVMGKIGQAGRMMAGGHGMAGAAAIGTISLAAGAKFAGSSMVGAARTHAKVKGVQSMGVSRSTARALVKGKIDINDPTKDGFALPGSGWHGTDSTFMTDLRKKVGPA